nr:MAG TPA: hypothetical protein [Crassvirales sp.]
MPSLTAEGCLLIFKYGRNAILYDFKTLQCAEID